LFFPMSIRVSLMCKTLHIAQQDIKKASSFVLQFLTLSIVRLDTPNKEPATFAERFSLNLAKIGCLGFQELIIGAQCQSMLS